ncbi:hypothetical protein M422DRAFT_47192 [Sphaerobolus stellatus SS14]|uniref:Uncharacterized protein n=1 Tax=Sphaerobolus stellatus (strain SS14) TaxID=990650 RepID=A0A0C9W0B1_SPHS4|nr:hypothetical protein M422DRAFT_47192 [Sphaerobolus stellatus SS14]
MSLRLVVRTMRGKRRLVSGADVERVGANGREANSDGSHIVTEGVASISAISLALGVGDVDDAFAAFTSYFKGSDHSRHNECLPMKAVNPGFILKLRKFNDISRSESGLVENSRSRPFSLTGAVFELGAYFQVEEHGNTNGNAHMEIKGY